MDMIFTPASILELLNQIDELEDYELGIAETLDGKLQLTVGDSIYEIEPENDTEIEVPEEVYDSIEEINEDTYEDLIEENDYEEAEVVEAGVIKEAVKSLLLGGAIRLASKLLK